MPAPLHLIGSSKDMGPFEVKFDTTGLELGRDYRLCSDLDGASGPLASSDTGLTVHVSAVSLRSGGSSVSIPRSFAEIQLLCVERCGGARAFLVADSMTCSETDLVGWPLLPDGWHATGGVLGGYGTSAWILKFDATSLSAGNHRLCLDLDGASSLYIPGDSGIMVQVS
jgi:hypothetical protein